ncbi:MAG: (2Fe-2S)-binding protein [Candidatus Celaenobacter polaris]|nr:(2Fe-2S)-binding protein [Candidatus Celaenobacter polaris]
MNIDFLVNGKPVSVEAEPLDRLLDILRYKLELTGTKEGCGEGECGACTVFMNNKLVNSCLVPAMHLHNANVVTIDGLRDFDFFRFITKAYEENGAVQCGFCTPGFVMSTINLLRNSSEKNVSDEEIKEAFEGNICRCTGYDKIIKSVRQLLTMDIIILERFYE